MSSKRKNPPSLFRFFHQNCPSTISNIEVEPIQSDKAQVPLVIADFQSACTTLLPLLLQGKEKGKDKMEHKVQAKLRISINTERSCNQLPIFTQRRKVAILQMAMTTKSPLTATLWPVAVNSPKLTVRRNFMGVDIDHKQNLMRSTGCVKP